MEFYNRRLLQLNEDVPISTSMSPLPLLQANEPTTTTNNNNNSSSSSSSSPPPSSSMFGRHLQLPPRPIFASNVAYAFLVLFTALFFLGFTILYIRQFSDDSPAAASSRRRRRRRHHDESVGPTAVKSLPEFSYHGDAKQQQQELDCAICLDEFRDGETVKVIPNCKHVFHPECIDTWLVAHVTCPICRCTKFCEVSVEVHGGGSTVENVGEGREVGSESESESLGERRRSSSGSRLGLGDTVALRRTLSC